MIVHPTCVSGAKLLELEPRSDARGFLARYFCRREFADAGLETQFVQMNNAVTRQRGTLRGMHYQLPPAAEVKIVRCVHGALFDVVVDLRPTSPTYLKWFGAELSRENRLMMYIPRGCAHGFLTLTDDVELIYMHSAYYTPECERGVRWDEPAIAIDWPATPLHLSDKDACWPALEDGHHGLELLSTTLEPVAAER